MLEAEEAAELQTIMQTPAEELRSERQGVGTATTQPGQSDSDSESEEEGELLLLQRQQQIRRKYRTLKSQLQQVSNTDSTRPGNSLPSP